MVINLEDFDAKRIEQLNVTMQTNCDVWQLMAQFVNDTPQFVTLEMLNQITDEYGMQPEMAFAMLFASACGFDTAENQLHKEIFADYFVPSVHCLNPDDYTDDMYLKTIKFPNKTIADWQFSTASYKPCEAFIFNEPVQTSDFKEVPQIGFFKEEFSYPVVMQNGREWMSLKPNEIETMRTHIENARGRVLVYGLGLGYYAFMVSQKKTITKVTVVEKDSNLIEIFEKEILPQFPNRAKIEIINDDAYAFASRIEPDSGIYDFIFSDIWHDTGDGLSMYLSLKALNSKINNCNCGYWIEKSLLSRLRVTVFDQMYRIFQQPKRNPNDGEKVITTYNDFIKMLSDNELRNIKVASNHSY